MASNDIIRQLNENISKFFNADLSFFYRDNAGQYSLKSELETIITGAGEKFNKAKKIAFDITDQTLIKLTVVVSAFSDNIRSVIAFNNEEYVTQREEVIRKFKIYYSDLLPIWAEIAPIYIDKLSGDNENIEDIIKSFKDGKTERDNYFQQLRELKTKSDNDANAIDQLKKRLENDLGAFEKRYKDLFTEGEILKQEQIFSTTATVAEKQSKYWLLAIFAGTLLFIAIIYCFINTCWIDFKGLRAENSSEITEKEYYKVLFYYELIRKSLLRILLLSTIGFLIKFTVKNYNALRHNITLNRHKANSLAAALILINRIPDGGKDGVINVASKEIFEQHKTGYLDKENQGLNINLLEKVLNILKKSPNEKVS